MRAVVLVLVALALTEEPARAGFAEVPRPDAATPGTPLVPVAINATGRILLEADVGGVRRPFVSHGGTATRLLGIDSDRGDAVATDINDAGTVSGSSSYEEPVDVDTTRAVGGAVVWAAGAAAPAEIGDLELFAGDDNEVGVGIGINPGGGVAGNTGHRNTGTFPAVWPGGGAPQAVDAGAFDRTALYTTQAGATLVVDLANSGPWRLYRSGVATDVECAGVNLQVTGRHPMNESAAIVGHATVMGVRKVYVWRDGVCDELPVPAGAGTVTTAAINDAGAAVGTSSTKGALLWPGDGTVLVLEESGWTLQGAVDIASDGRVLGFGVKGSDPVARAWVIDAAPPVGLVVNSTADRPRSAAVPVTSCDTGEVVGSAPECTLRAALQAVEGGASEHRITFAIPGGESPVIAPGSALPATTRTVDIDATTQGGWVVLSGTNAGAVDGLEISGLGSTVQGLVVNGFADGAGIVAGGSLGLQVITGNRIGTDASGTQSVPNRVGVLAQAPDVRIGGIAGTQPSVCTGACNLIAGNTQAQVGNGRGTGGPQPIRSLRILGNWIGLSAGGTALDAPAGAASGIDILATGAVAGSDPQAHLSVGGLSAAPGEAPGNRIAAKGTAVGVVLFGAEGGARAVVAGNTIGLDRGGAGAAGHGKTGALLFAVDGARIVIGGREAGARNVVGGFDQGVLVSGGVDVIGNRVGTDVSGTTAVPNGVGFGHVLEVGVGKVEDNLFSGNHIGVGGEQSAFLGSGNLVGLAADGRTALPNDIGVGYDKPHDPGFPFGRTITSDGGACRADPPCNVISGNRVAGILDDGDGFLLLEGTYIGTDVTGTAAVPNGVGIRLRSRALAQVGIGGATGVAGGGTCADPCNIIAGNTGGGVRLESTNAGDLAVQGVGSLSGNLIGAGADGRPLPNGGAGQVVVDGAPRIGADPFTVGGDAAHGNLIASRAGTGVAIGGTADNYAAAAVRGNRFRMLDGSSAITRPAASVAAPIIERYAAAGPQVAVSGSTRRTTDPALPAETVELYAASACAGAREIVPLAAGAAAKLGGDFTLGVPVAALAGRPVLLALRTDAQNATSAFSACFPGPKVARTTTAAKAGATTLAVDTNAGWKAGDYARVLTAKPTIRRVAKLGSLVFGAPLPRPAAAGTYVISVPAPRGDTRPPRIRIAGLRKRYGRRQRATVRFRCADGRGVGVERCPPRLRLDTRRPGARRVAVRAWDANGNVAVKTLRYRVVSGRRS